MNNKGEIVVKRMAFQAEKEFIGYDEGDNPALEPLFANHLEFFPIGTDIFLDIGIIKPEDILAQGSAVPAGEQQKEAQKIKFHVLYRVAMSADTFFRLQQNMSNVLSAIKVGMKQYAQTHSAD